MIDLPFRRHDEARLAGRRLRVEPTPIRAPERIIACFLTRENSRMTVFARIQRMKSALLARPYTPSATS
jgi:hypothetical protein